MLLSLHDTCSCIFHEYIPSFLYIHILNCFGAFLLVPLSLSLFQFASWHLSVNPLCPEIIFILGHLLPLTPLLPFSFVMKGPVRTSQRTFLDETFIRNAKSSYRTFSILTYPLSSTVGVGSHCVASRSPVPL